MNFLNLAIGLGLAGVLGLPPSAKPAIAGQSTFHAPIVAAYPAAGDVSIYRNPKVRIQYLKYASILGRERVVGVTNKKDKLLVVEDDGSFTLVDRSAATFDEAANDLLYAALKSGERKVFQATIGDKSIRIEVRRPLDSIVASCTNIPTILDISMNNNIFSVAPIIPAADNEQCGPQASYSSKYESFNLYMPSPIALLSNRFALVFGQHILTVPFDMTKSQTERCPLLLPADAYDTIIKTALAKTGSDEPDVPTLENAIEVGIQKRQSEKSMLGCRAT